MIICVGIMQITIKRFTEEQLQRASSIDIARMLESQGETLKKQGSVYRWMRYDSTVICGNEWYRHSRQTGGGPIQFMQHFYNMNFVDSVKYLLNGEEGAKLVPATQIKSEKSEFKMPKLSKNMHRTFAYLTKTRKIDPEIIRFFVQEKKIFETESHHNIAFCGYNENDEIKHIHLRNSRSDERFFMDIEGSDKRYCFRHIGNDNEIFIFEAPIDMLSYITMNKEDWQKHSYVSLGGVAVDAVVNVLDTIPKINTVHICVDNDAAGDKTVKRIAKTLESRGIFYDRITPQKKDWNEDLIALREQTETENMCMNM